MKPGDSPEFFDRPAPEGRSRESTIRLDALGRFWHDQELVTHPRMAAALVSWIGRHPRNGRYILSNGYDWTYFAVDDVPFRVDGIRIGHDAVTLILNDGTEEVLRPASARVGEGDALVVSIKCSAPGGPYEAKFTRHAQTSLAPVLVHEGDPRASTGVPGTLAIRLAGGSAFPLLAPPCEF